MSHQQQATLGVNHNASLGRPPFADEYAGITAPSCDQDQQKSGDHDAPSQYSSISPSVLAHIVDVHCHPTDSGIETDVFRTLPHKLCAMATRESDQKLVAQLAREYPDKVIPCFGFHPWFTHLISVKAADSLPPVEEHYRELFDPTDPAQEEAFGALLPHLPAPTPLSAILDNVRAHLLEFPSAMLGEVGIDRSARIAHSYAANPRFLSPFTIPTEHQLAILEAQLDLAVELGRSVSLHSVKAQQITVDLLNRLKAKHGHAWLEINVDLHSCGLSSETWKRIQSQHPNVYISLSVGINSRSPNHVALIKAAAPERILAESDYHTAAQSGPMTWRMIGVIAQNRGWGVEEEWSYAEDDVAIGVHKSGWGAVRRLEHNWKAFVHGRHAAIT